MKALKALLLAALITFSALTSPSYAVTADSFELGTVQFGSGSARMSKSVKAQLDTIILNMSSSEDSLTVTGYDPKGGGTKLAKKRANAVVKYIQAHGYSGTIVAAVANSTSKSGKKAESRKTVIATDRKAYAISGKVKIFTNDATACSGYSITGVTLDGSLRDYVGTIGTETLDSGSTYCTMTWTLPGAIAGHYKVDVSISCEQVGYCDTLRDYNGPSGAAASDLLLTVPMRGASGNYAKSAKVSTTLDMAVEKDLTGVNDYMTNTHSILNFTLWTDSFN